MSALSAKRCCGPYSRVVFGAECISNDLNLEKPESAATQPVCTFGLQVKQPFSRFKLLDVMAVPK